MLKKRIVVFLPPPPGNTNSQKKIWVDFVSDVKMIFKNPPRPPLCTNYNILIKIFWTRCTSLFFTTDEKPTVVYPIPDEIPTTLAFTSVNWCKIDVFTLNIMVLHHKMSQTINNNKNTK